MEAQSLGHLIVELTAYHLYHTLFTRGKLLGPSHTPGEAITQGCEYQEEDIYRRPPEK